MSSVNQVQTSDDSSLWNFPDYVLNPSIDILRTCVPLEGENMRSLSPWSLFPPLEPPKLSDGSNLLSSLRNGTSPGIENEIPYSFNNIPSRFRSSIPERDHQTLASNTNEKAPSFHLEHAATSVSSRHSFSKSSRKFGRRNGPLRTENRQRAAATRKNGACWQCRAARSSVCMSIQLEYMDRTLTKYLVSTSNSLRSM
jgi:hypothetical protein